MAQPTVGAMKIARNPGFSGRHDEWHPPFRRGDENRPKPRIFRAAR